MAWNRYEKEELAFNGINGSTGRPLLPPLNVEEIARRALGEDPDATTLADLREEKKRRDEQRMIPCAWVTDIGRLEDTGWGVVFPYNCDPQIPLALKPLLEHRQQLAGRLYKELIYRPHETKMKFLARHGVGVGPVDPSIAPYYLLLVGGPDEISFDIQAQLDIQYAVGRLHFETPREYEHYARSVVRVETEGATRSRRASFFGVSHPQDRATQRSRRELVEPLADAFESRSRAIGWNTEKICAEEATKARLIDLLANEEKGSALVFTASHGIGFGPEDPLQESDQGALLCQDWTGPTVHEKPISKDAYLAAEDIGDHADISSLILISFACYSAGTPQFDSFAQRGSREIAPRSFVAGLPKRLLGHPGGSALAVVGHVDRTWSYAFRWPQSERQIQVFESMLVRLLQGQPVGAAMEDLNGRYAELATELNRETTKVNRDQEPPDFLSISGLWTATQDAGSFVVLGDPAVRLAVSDVDHE